MIKKMMAILITVMFFGLVVSHAAFGNNNNLITENREDTNSYPWDYYTGEKTSDIDNNGYGNPPDNPLPRWREGGTPYDNKQPLYPYAIHTARSRDTPLSGLIESPPEYAPTRGVLFWYYPDPYQWYNVVSDLVVALTQDDQFDEIAYVVVTSETYKNSATSLFTSAGANMSKVKFIIQPGETIWLRDYGPHFIFQEGNLGIVDSHYYPTRPDDNFNPTLLGDDYFIMPTYDMGLYYSGGNFQPGPNRTGFVTSLIRTDNPVSGGFNDTFIGELYQTYQGIDTLHIMSQLPGSVDGTGHIDMWFYIIDNNTVIISEFIPGSNPTAIQITNNAATYMEALGFTVYRTPAWNAPHPSNGYSTHWTYTNSFRVNNRIFIPTFGETYTPYADEDADALAAFQAAAGPHVEIIQIDSYPIIWAAGALHCILMQVPRYINPEPSIHLINPNGGELLVPGTTETISWVATDTDNTNISHIDLYYSLNGGDTYNYITTTNDTGFYDWNIPATITNQALIKVVAHSITTNQAEDTSNSFFKIAPSQQTIYDFSTGAGTDKFGWGYQTVSWNTIDSTRLPVSTQLTSNEYVKISSSDDNRYISPNPSDNSESTHVFEFTITENPDIIDDIQIICEGYSDQCAQIELYIWDYVEGQWSDGQGRYGQNHFIDNWAGNYDGFLDFNIKSNFTRYINGSGQMTLLTYSERGPDGYYVTYNPSFHDYMAVIVSEINDGPHINNVEASPVASNIGDWVNISCDVIAPEGIEGVYAVVLYPDNTSVNQTMINIDGTTYYYNVSYSQPGNYSFYIWACDEEGNMNMSLEYWFNVVSFSHLFNFSMGWNLITIPFENSWTAESLGENISGCNLVLRFNASRQEFDTHVVGNVYDDFPIVDGVGYFIRVSGDTMFNCEGLSIIPSVNVTVYDGWNTLGWFHDYSTTAQSLGENVSASLVLMFDASTQEFMTYVMNSGYDNFIITRGMAVFIQTSTPGWWQGEG